MKLTITHPLTSQEQTQVARHLAYVTRQRQIERQVRQAVKARNYALVQQLGQELRALTASELAAAQGERR